MSTPVPSPSMYGMIGLSGTDSEKSLLTLIFSPPEGILMCWYAMEPSFMGEGTREERAQLYKTQLQIERALHQPDRGNEDDRGRTADEDQAAIDPVPAQREGERQERGDDRELSAFHAEIEADEGDEQRALRQPKA